MDNTIDIIVRSYRNACRIVRQAEDHLIGISEKDLNTAILIKERIESEVRFLDEKHSIFIENEVINGRTGNWYALKMSPATYYRNRKKAYATFVENLKD
ncbi:MAG: MG284/MPN403 family protein [Erysipelotrichaceae bacterium]